MSEPKLISPLLDNFAIGGAISTHHGISCCPAMENNTDDKYIVKIISVPSSQDKLDALLLTGAFSSLDAALNYFKESADAVIKEVQILDNLSNLEGFLPYQGHQLIEKEDGSGFEVYLLSRYRRTLSRQFSKAPLTHLDVLNLGLDLCAALAVCRRSGYLYVDLKPNNIYVSHDKSYFIGDLGFVPLDSLKYTSMPEKYMSVYTAPEIEDAFSALNTTVDIYALGLILYQAYNNAALPVANEEGIIPPPQYADYEMAEIIMKALCPDPQDRWQDPTELGQALVSYMQRNGAHDTPIIPPAAPVENHEELTETEEEAPIEEVPAAEVEEEPVVAETEQEIPEGSVQAEDEPEIPEDTTPVEEEPEVSEEPVVEETCDESTVEAAVESDASEEDEYENLSFIDEELTAEELDVSYEQITDEVSEILSQADELVSHQIPDPVVAPDPIEIPMPEPIVIEEPVSEDEEVQDIQPSNEESEDSTDEETVQEESEDEKPAKKKMRGWLKAIIWVVVVAALLFGAIYYYQNYYLQTVNNITVDGQEDYLTVTVKTEAPEESVIVICTDTHGNQLSQPLVNGKADFDELLPNTTYTVSLKPDGFYKLIGKISATYSTPIQSKIVQFNAVTGAEDGSAILSFTVEGPDSEKWNVTYSSADQEEVVTFPGHTVSINGLTVGQEYTFTLSPVTELFVTGTEQIIHTASKLIYPQNVNVVSCIDGKLTIQWDSPQDAEVSSWLVRCNGQDYSQTITTEENTAVFEGITDSAAYDVEVLAVGMSVSQKVSVPANSISIFNATLERNSPTLLDLSWEANSDVPNDGWILNVLADGQEVYAPIISTDNSVSVGSLIPGCTYSFRITSIEGNVLCAPIVYQMPEAQTFTCDYDGKEITAEDMSFRMCRRPDRNYWNRYHLYDEDYTTTFQSGERAAYVVHFEKSYGNSVDDYEITYVIKDKDGKLISVNSQYTIWNEMWYIYYGHFDVPRIPDTAGEYIIDIYFNGALANSQEFTVQ